MVINGGLMVFNGCLNNCLMGLWNIISLEPPIIGTVGM